MKTIYLAGGCFWGAQKFFDQFDGIIATEVLKLQNFFSAEEYHQNYLDKNPGGYCHIAPEYFTIAK